MRQRQELGQGEPFLSIIIEGCWPGLREALENQSCLRFEVLTGAKTGLPRERVLAGVSCCQRGQFARGMGLAFLPEGALPAREWVYHLTKPLLEGADMVYTDEEVITDTGAYEPEFKPGFGFCSLLGRNILGESVAMTMKLYRRCGGLRERTAEGWYDFLLRGAEQAGRIGHIPLVLLSLQKQSLSAEPWPVERALIRQGLRGTVGTGAYSGTFSPRFFGVGMPLVTLLLRASGELYPLKNLLEWVERRSVYFRYEWVISCCEKVAGDMETYLQALERSGAARIYREEGTKALCLNRCARRAKGAYLLFMEEGCLPLTANFTGRLLEWASLPGMGAAGGSHCWRRKTIFLPEGMPGLGAATIPKGENARWTEVVRNVSFLPAGGVMMKKERFWGAGGLEETLERGYMEAMTLTMGRRGYGAVYCPDARFALCNPPNRQPMEPRCREIFRSILREGDPLFTPHLCLGNRGLGTYLPPLPPGEQCGHV